MNCSAFDWQQNLTQLHPGFAAIKHSLTPFQQHQKFTSINEYNQHAKNIINANNQTIQFTQQAASCNEHYEQKIYETGQVNTRENNWHDFFNYCVWQTFPVAKTVINQLQYQDLQKQQFVKTRTPRQNFLTQFDESGVIIVSRNPQLIDLLQNHQWQALFWEQRESLQQDMQFMVFGHAIYEKLLSPYIGLTAKGIILERTDAENIDEYLAEYLQNLSNCRAKDLQPVPLLGLPGWHVNTDNPEFYLDEGYFRGRASIL